MSLRLPRPKLALERFTLDNGLRVVLNPDRSAPVVGIAVYYDVGFRSEPEGRTGFAHLFEHLMFQETPNLGKGEADRLIEGNGGNGNGSTQPDSTVYICTLPSNALELGLFLEADRMRGTRLTAESLRNQIDVVKEEINVNVNNKPYGGFPWIDLPPVMFTSFNNAHNGYGSFVDLEAATVEDAASFFSRYYAPGNAVLAVAGDLDPAITRRLIETHFGSLPRRRVGRLPSFDEPVVDTVRSTVKVDPLAPMPAVAVGYRVPDPLTDPTFWALVVLGDLLFGGDASRLYQRLVKRDRLAVDIAGSVGPFGDPFDMRGPTMLEILAWHPGASVDDVTSAIDASVAEIVAGVSQAEIDRVVTGLVSVHLRQLDNVLDRAAMIGQLELLRGRAELANEYPAIVSAVTPEEVSAVADKWMAGAGRAILSVVPA